MDDGYGLNDQVVEIAQKCHATLVISVDCGITALKEAKILKENKIDLIVIDHHEPSDQGIPDAVAVIDPKRSDCPYPFKHLAAVGLAAKFAQAMTGEMPTDILDLVALGTVTDVVPLCGENRLLVKQGLPLIERTQNKGLQALLEVASIKGKTLKPYHAGFIIGPRINAAGRMDSARRALDLLLSDNEVEALKIAKELDAINTKRQQLQRRIIQEAMDMIEHDVNFKDHRVIVLAKEGWHRGVLGIVASRVVETFYRPAIVAAIENGFGFASARSIDGFHLHEALTSCSDVLEEFGGHKLAAGLTVHQDKIEVFRDRINAYALENLDAADLTPTLIIDGEVPFSRLTVDLIDDIDLLEPYGEGNRSPIFCSHGLMVKSRPVVLAKETLKFWVSDGNVTLSVVGFGMGKYAEYLAMGQKIDLAYELTIDDWNKAPTVQLKLKDLRIREGEILSSKF
jgi:single-stranded-DNA-specific exonuclease